MTFWKELKRVVAGPNTLGPLKVFGDLLLSELNDYHTNKGIFRIEARPIPNAPGYNLTGTQDYGPNVAEVYFLPWKNGEVTVAARTEYENSRRDIFFLTSTMSGCRFSVTPDMVLHVANSAGYDSAGRSAREEAITGPRDPSTRRLSVSAPATPGDLQYGGRWVGAYTRALVFGMRVNGVYTYKEWDSHTDRWSILY